MQSLVDERTKIIQQYQKHNKKLQPKLKKFSYNNEQAKQQLKQNNNNDKINIFQVSYEWKIEKLQLINFCIL